MRHELRDLAAGIEAVAKTHPAYSQAVKIIAACCDHLCAVARIHELEALDRERRAAAVLNTAFERENELQRLLNRLAHLPMGQD